LSDAELHYCDARDLDRVAKNTVFRAFKWVFDASGDLPIADYSHKDVGALIKSLLDTGLKTATLSRELGVVRVAIGELLVEHELTLSVSNPFTDLKIPKLRQDAKKRAVFTCEQLAKVRGFVSSKDCPTTNAVGLLLDTGARFSEVVGLSLILLQTSDPWC
jgi:site-specific recombinase XerD